MITHFSSGLSVDPVAVQLLAAALTAVVTVLTERALNRWVPEPRLAKPEPEFIM